MASGKVVVSRDEWEKVVKVLDSKKGPVQIVGGDLLSRKDLCNLLQENDKSRAYWYITCNATHEEARNGLVPDDLTGVFESQEDMVGYLKDRHVKEQVMIYDNAMFYPKTTTEMLKRKGSFLIRSVSVAPFRVPSQVIAVSSKRRN